MRFLACLAVASWFPHVEGAARWVWLGVFLSSLVVLLRGVET